MLNVFPADEFALFESPVAASVICTGNVDTLVSADPTRVLLAISGDGSSTFKLRPTGSRPSSDIDTGLFLVPGAPLLIMDYTQHGPLVQSGWQVIGQIAAIISVVTVQLRRDPQMYGFRGVFADPAFTAPVPAPSSMRGMTKGRKVHRGGAVPDFLRRTMPRFLGEE